MAINYLDKYVSTLPTTQSRQILRVLSKERTRGSIRTLDDFKKRLATLTAELQNDILTPSLKTFMAVSGERIDSDTYNEMISRIIDDLTAGFTEATNVDEILTLHTNLVVDVLLKSLDFTINELESRIRLYEFLDKSPDGFTGAKFDTFKGLIGNRLTRDTVDGALTFIDPQLNTFVPSNLDSQVDLIAQKLTLGTDNELQVPIASIRQIFDESSNASEIQVSFKEEDSDINNIIDQTKGTFWLYNVLTRLPVNNGITVRLELELPAYQKVNILEIEPASLTPFSLVDIFYRDSKGSFVSIPAFEPILIDKNQTISFAPIVTSKLQLVFNQRNPVDSQFELKNGTDLIANRNNPEAVVSLDDIRTELEEVFDSSFILNDILGFSTPQEVENASFHEYIVGFDNIRVKASSYDFKSIFVSSALDVTKPTILGLRVLEERSRTIAFSTEVNNTSDTYLIPDTRPVRLGAFTGTWANNTGVDNFYHNSIEYTVIKKDFSAVGALVNTSIFPILPLGVAIIPHERLHLVKGLQGIRKTVGFTRFFPVLPDPIEPKTVLPVNDSFLNYDSNLRKYIRVYRNGTEIPPKDEFDTPETGWTLVTDPDETIVTPNFGLPMRAAIKIEDPLITDIFTVTYIPAVGDTFAPSSSAANINVVDLTGDTSVRILGNNLLALSSTVKSQEISRSEFFLNIVQRRNSSNIDITSSVLEYSLFSANEDPDRLKSDFDGE